MSPITPPPAHVQPAFAELAGPVALRSASQAPHGWSVHVVRAGDTLSDLARTRRTTVAALVKKNRLRTAGVILQVGQRLAVPRVRPARALSARNASRVSDTTYIVRPGDTLEGIAGRHSMSTARLLSANRLANANVLRPGQRLTIPNGRASAKKTAKASRSRAARTGRVVYRVRAGDTISSIAAKYGMSTATLLGSNRLANANVLKPGQKLLISSVTTRSATSGGTGVGRTPSGARLGAAARANLRYLNSHSAPSRTAVKSMITSAARRHGVDPRLALAIGWQESRWNQRAVSEDNAIGIMQCLPTTGQWMSGVLGRRINLLNAHDNVQCGVGLLRTLGRSVATEREVIAAYYQGLGSLRSRGMYDETKTYVASVLRHKARM